MFLDIIELNLSLVLALELLDSGLPNGDDVPMVHLMLDLQHGLVLFFGLAAVLLVSREVYPCHIVNHVCALLSRRQLSLFELAKDAIFELVEKPDKLNSLQNSQQLRLVELNLCSHFSFLPAYNDCCFYLWKV